MPLFLLMIEDASRREEYSAAYYKYRQHLFAVAKTILKDDTLAEDAIQNAFLSIIEKDSLPSADESRIKVFLTIAVRNKAVDILRQRGMLSARELTDAQLGIAAAIEKSEHSQRVSELALALSELPAEHKDLLIKHYYVGISAKELARQEHVNYRTMLRRIETAEGLLKAALKEDDT